MRDFDRGGRRLLYLNHSMLAKKFSFRSDEFLVLEVFLAVVAFGLFAGALFIVISATTPPAPTVPVVLAESEEEYRTAAKEVLDPFFSQVSHMTAAGVRAAAPEMRDLVQKTQDRLLRMERIPKESQATHLSYVLLLGQWIRVLDNAGVGADAVVTKTAEVLKENPLW